MPSMSVRCCAAEELGSPLWFVPGVSAQARLIPRGQTALVEGAVAPVLNAYLQQVQAALGCATLCG